MFSGDEIRAENPLRSKDPSSIHVFNNNEQDKKKRMEEQQEALTG